MTLKLSDVKKVIFIVAATYILPLNGYGQLWQHVGGAGFSAGAAYYTSMAISPNETPYTAYQDAAHNNAVTVIKYSSSAWTNVGATGFSPANASSISLAINKAGIPYVAFIDDSSEKISVMKYNGVGWIFVGSAFFSDSANEAVMALGKNDTVYVAYIDASYNSKVSVVQFNGTTWANVGTPGFSDSADEVALAIDTNTGVPYIAYTDAPNGDNTTVMMYNGSTWANVGLPDFSVADAYYISLAINHSDVPYIAYQDGAYSGKVTVMNYTLGNWDTVGVSGFSVGAAYYTSLAIDSAGTPFVAYQDNAHADALSVMQYAGASWSPVGPQGCTLGTADYTSLAIDRHGRLYVAYQDGAKTSRASVVVYQNCNNGNPAIYISAVGPDTLCPDTKALLTASGGSTYRWNYGDTNSAIQPVLVNANSAYTFYVTGTTAGGCASTDSIKVYTRPQPPPTSVSLSVTLCKGDTTLLSASGNLTYSWSNGATASSVLVSPASTTTYYVAGADAQGCTDTAYTTITVDKGPLLTFSGNDTLCKGDSTTLFVTGGLSYMWQPGGSTQNSLSPAPSSTTTYTVTSTDISGCTSKDSVTVVVEICNGISKINFEQGFNLWPNPAHHYAFFTAYMPLTNAQLTIYTLSGQIIKHILIKNLAAGAYKRINVANLSDGLYYLRVTSEKGTAIYKLIKE